MLNRNRVYTTKKKFRIQFPNYGDNEASKNFLNLQYCVREEKISEQNDHKTNLGPLKNQSLTGIFTAPTPIQSVFVLFLVRKTFSKKLVVCHKYFLHDFFLQQVHNLNFEKQ
jgi:hypothetical protein